MHVHSILADKSRKKVKAMNIGFKINKNFHRPSRDVLAEFADIPIPNIGDAMQRTAAISSSIKSVNNERLSGTAYTVRVPAGDNLLFYYAIDQASPGDVIVVDGGGFTERALCGEIMATLAKERGLAGFVINGAIRDYVELSQMEFPVFAIASCPNGPYKNGPGEINVPVNIGGRIVCPGDILIGDKNGLVSFKEEEVPEIIENVNTIIKKEQALMDDIKKNRRMDLRWMYQKLAVEQCTITE